MLEFNQKPSCGWRRLPRAGASPPERARLEHICKEYAGRLSNWEMRDWQKQNQP